MFDVYKNTRNKRDVTAFYGTKIVSNMQHNNLDGQQQTFYGIKPKFLESQTDVLHITGPE